MKVQKRDGRLEELNIENIRKQTIPACEGLAGTSYEDLELSASILFTDGINTSDIQKALINTAHNKISLDKPNWGFVAARLGFYDIYHTIKETYRIKESGDVYKHVTLQMYLDRAKHILSDFVNKYSKEDIEKLNNIIDGKKDMLFNYPGYRVLKDRYLLIDLGELIELPQHMIMAIAMFVAQNEEDKVYWASEFYKVISDLKFIPATPIQSNGRVKNGSTASCFLTSIADTSDSIFDSYKEIAFGSKVGGGWGVDVTRLRSLGSTIGHRLNAAGGAIPFIKILNDIALAVDQNGKRAGAFAIYMESWCIDFPDFLDMCKRSGEERRRGQDLFYAVSASDLFIKRIKENTKWTLFDPRDVPELSETWGEEFEKYYLQAEEDFLSGKRKFNPNTKQIEIADLVSKMMYNWVTEGKLFWFFKDTVNRAHEHKHLGIIRSSNLCCEITMPTDENRTAVCNLGSINLSRVESIEDLTKTSKLAARFLDDVIDVTEYHSERAEKTQKAMRSFGCGTIGEAEYIATRQIHYGSPEHIEVIKELYGTISNTLKETSIELAKERGSCEAVPGIRNAYRMAIAPNTSTSLFAGSVASCEPIYAKETVEISKLGNYKVMAPNISIDNIAYYKNAFEIDQKVLIDTNAIRQQFIDMSISQSLYIDATDYMGTGRPVSAMDIIKLIIRAHSKGLKTLYYFRSKAKKNDSAITGKGGITCSGCEN